jgi:alkylhydroperoxidase family enzyme
MARTDYADPSTKSEKTRTILDRLDHKNIFRMLAHSDSHLLNYCRLGNAIRYKGELDPCLREIAITRAGILCGSDYEVIAQKRIGKDVGLSQEKIDNLERGAESDAYTDLEKLVLRYTDEVVNEQQVSEETFRGIEAALTPAAHVELHLAIGYYIMTSKFLCTFGIDLQSD